jgi:carbonic anhydrase
MILFLFGLLALSLSLKTSEKLSSLAKQSGYNLENEEQSNALSFDENYQAPQKGEFNNLINFYEGPKNKTKKAKTNKHAKKVNNTKKKKKLRKRRTFKDPIKLLKEGWMKISSPNFLHTGRFPLITLPNGKQVRIKTTKNYFRINVAFNPMKTKKNFPPKKTFFWFRLSGKHLYYSQLQNDINILGNIAMKNVKNAKDSGEAHCFRIVDRARRKWKLCADKEKTRNKWVCLIKNILGFPEDKTCKTTKLEESNIPTVVTKKITQPIILIPLASRVCNDGWDYLKKGSDWECDCADGLEQSPISLPPKDKAILSPIKPIFRFQELKVAREETTDDGQHKGTKNVNLEFKNGALRIKHKIFGKAVTLDGAVYAADEIVFHSPSEHQLNGKNYDMEMQIIFHGLTKGDIAKHVVLSFLFEKAPGVYNKFIDDLDFFSLPNPIQKSRKLLTSLFIPRIFYSAGEESQDVIKPFSFYTYHGSITQPPCSERTINYVASKPIKLGSTALHLFQESIRTPDKLMSNGDVIISSVPPENNRLPQKLNGRAIFYYDHKKFCGGIEGANKKAKPKGHYEKVDKKIVNYYYVNGENPSGMPGALVVSRNEAIGKEEKDDKK